MVIWGVKVLRCWYYIAQSLAALYVIGDVVFQMSTQMLNLRQRTHRNFFYFEHVVLRISWCVSEWSFTALETAEELYHRRVTRILTTNFPRYFAIVTSILAETSVLGPDGGVVNSPVVSQIEAVVPQGAFTKKIRLSLLVRWALCLLLFESLSHFLCFCPSALLRACLFVSVFVDSSLFLQWQVV